MRKLSILTIVLLVVVTTIQAQWAQIGADINGEAALDNSGKSVSLSADGSVLAIGAYYNNGNGSAAGHVRVYKNISGTWTQIGDDINGEAAGDLYGYSVSLSADGSVLAIGAYLNDGNGKTDAGHVRVYQNNGGTWTQIGADINGEGAGDWSGYSVSLSADGSVLAIGAPNNDGVNKADAGHVRVYENLSGRWTKVGADIDGEAAGDNSGKSVSLSADGSVLAIGAKFNDVNGTNAGHVRVYKNNGGIWTQIGADIDGEAAGDNSGQSVSLSTGGSVLAIGANKNDGGGAADAGHVRVYKNINGGWEQIGTDIDGEAAGDYSGHSVSLSADGSMLAIGAYANDGNGSDAGHVRVYGADLTISQPISLNEISIYPNPTSGKLTIKNGQLIIKNIEITDITGKTILSSSNSQIKQFSNLEIDLSGLNNGIYFISIQTDNEIFTSKIIKK